MKKLVYFIVLIVIINNIFLLNTHSNLQKDIKLKKNKFANEQIEVEKTYIDYLHKISDSSYIENIKSIDILSDKLSIKFSLNSSINIKDLVSDTEKCFGKNILKTNIYNDENIIIEFGE